MEEGLPRKPYKVSARFSKNLRKVYAYGIITFGYFQAERYNKQIENAVSTLSAHYLAYPECRHIATKSRRYRNIILDSHLIIYRITAVRIEVLDIIHSTSSISKICSVRNVRIKD